MHLCPKCNHNLTPLTVNTASRGLVNLEHCYFCGGVWLDHYDINRLNFNDTLYLSHMATKGNLAKTKSSNKCPRDKATLVQVRAESVPEGVTVLACPKCGGNFITKDELKELKKAQKIKLDYFKTWKIPLPSLSAVLIPILFIFALTTGVFITVKNLQKREELKIKAKEIIGVPEVFVSQKNTVLVSFSTSVPTFSSIVYKAENEVEPHTVPVSIQKQTQHIVTLQNLFPKTNYTLKIYVEEIPGQILSSSDYSFTTN